MATQLKDLTFNDNVLNVSSTFTPPSGVNTESWPNISFGNAAIYENTSECGFLSLCIQGSGVDAVLTLMDYCGRRDVTVGGGSYHNGVTMYEQDSAVVVLEPQCGNFAICDSCGQSRLRVCTSDPKIFIGDISLEDRCGLGMMLKVQDSCGSTLFTSYADYGDPRISVGGVMIGTNCGYHGIFEACGGYGLSIGDDGSAEIYRGAVYAGSRLDYSNVAASGYFVGSGVWVPDVTSILVGGGSLYVDSDGFVKLDTSPQ